MRRLGAFLAVFALLATAAACGGSSHQPSAAEVFQGAVQGTWTTVCRSIPGSSRDTWTFAGPAVSFNGYGYSDASCNTLVATTTTSGTLAYGAPVSAALGATTVTAYQLDITGGMTSYTIGYVDTSVTPHLLYLGDTNSSNDGSSPAKRPTTLAASPFSKQ